MRLNRRNCSELFQTVIVGAEWLSPRQIHCWKTYLQGYKKVRGKNKGRVLQLAATSALAGRANYPWSNGQIAGFSLAKISGKTQPQMHFPRHGIKPTKPNWSKPALMDPLLAETIPVGIPHKAEDFLANEKPAFSTNWSLNANSGSSIGLALNCLRSG